MTAMTYDQLAALRDASAHAATAVADAQARLAELQARGGSPIEIKAAVMALARLRQTAAGSDASYRAALAQAISALDPATPLLLLPVRIETRFRPQSTSPGANVDLLIRVYPDDVYIDGHEPGLIAAEVDAGQQFWQAMWGADTAPERAVAWSALVNRVGPTRAAWVARALTPTNAPRPGASPAFPTPPQQASRWTRAAQAQALPDQWIALAYRAGATLAEARGGLVARPLATGLSPMDSTELADPAMRWMVDFAAAQQAGMGLVMGLTAQQAAQIDVLLVTGVRASAPPTESADTLTALLAAHRYTWGLDLVPIGTPTNNTTGARAGRTVEPAPDLVPPAPILDADAATLGVALGLPPGLTSGLAPLDALATGDLHDQRDAADMATALWPATWGYYLTQILRPLFGDVALDDWRRWVITTLRGRGPLPALRVGDQPYGVLPVTSLERWRPTPDTRELLVLRSVLAPDVRTQLGVLWDLDAAGGWSDAAEPIDLPLPTGATSAGLAAADLDSDGQVEIVVGWLAADHRRAGYAIFRLDPDGTPGAELARGDIPLAHPAAALAIAITAAAGAPPGLVALIQPEVTGRPPPATLLVGAALDVQLPIASWTAPVLVDALAPGERLLGIAVADLDGDNQPELIVLADGAGVVRYRVGSGALGTPTPLVWAAAYDVTTAGVPSTAGGIAFADVDDDGALEAIVHYSWDGGGVAAGSYRVGDQLDRAGRPARWLGPYNTGSSSPGTPAGGGIAYANVGRSPRAGWTSMRGRINLLLRLRELWRTAAASVPRVGVGDPDQTLLDLLASDAGSAAVAVRPVIGPLVAESLWFAVNDPLAATYRSDLEARLAPAAALAGLTGTPRLGSLAYAPDVVDDAAPLGADQPTSYLAEMAIATPRQLHDKWIGPGIPLLARLIRHGLLQAYADAALRLVPVDLVEPELVDLADVTAQDPATPGHTLTSWRHLAETTLNGVPVADLLHKAAHSSRPGPEAAPVAEAIAAVRRLAALPADALHRLMMETLDLSTHRLDAWMTAVATQRMRELRHRQPTGIQLGGYGIVTDLRPATGAASTGYVHAPSIGHAATAAVLRSGYLSHGSEALAVDLSSTRARLALDLLDGIRSGQSLGTLLGYRFERELADRGVSQYLPALRQLAPEVVGQLTAPPAGTAVEAVSALATVDGLALLTRWRDQAIPWGGSVPGQPGNLPATGTADQIALIAALTVLRDTVDAVADVGVAESVHQALQGNHLRAGGSLDALSRGELPPPEPDVLRSPRTGVALTHRLVVIADDPDAAPALSAWKATAAQQALWQRAIAEPRLNAWAATVLGDPGRVRWRASFVDAATGAPSAQPERTFTLAEVGLCPLDVLYGPSPTVAALGETDLGRRLCAHAAAATAAVVPPVAPMLVSERDAAWSPQLLALGELLTVAELARDLVGGARAADARDLAPAGLTAVPGVLGDDLDRRAEAAIAGFADARSALRAPFQLQAGEPAVLRAALTAPDIPDDATSLLALPAHVDIAAACRALQRPSVTALAEVRAPLTRLSAFGIPGAAPRNVAGSDDAARGALAIQARDIAQAAAARATRAAAATDATGRLHAILGDDFCVLPLFAPAHPGDLTEALAVRDKAGDALTAAVEDWFEGAARVRIGAHRLCDVRLIAPVVGGETAALVALQLPPRRGDRWVGAALPPDATMTGGITGIAIASHQPWRPDAAQAGLVVDEWVEVVPNRAETTGLVFHYDAPGACAPQALLLAVSPDPSRPWDLATLAAILLETIDATRIRAVRPHDVRQLGHVVPALLFARNAGGDPAGDTISTTFES